MFPHQPPHQELATEPVGSPCERLICYYPFTLSWIHYMASKHFTLFFYLLIVMTHIESHHRRQARQTEREDTPFRHSGAHSPRVMPGDMAAGRLDILGKKQKVHKGCLLFSCAKIKCQHAGWDHAPALHLREFQIFLCCWAPNRYTVGHKVPFK